MYRFFSSFLFLLLLFGAYLLAVTFTIHMWILDKTHLHFSYKMFPTRLFITYWLQSAHKNIVYSYTYVYVSLLLCCYVNLIFLFLLLLHMPLHSMRNISINLFIRILILSGNEAVKVCLFVCLYVFFSRPSLFDRHAEL